MAGPSPEPASGLEALEEIRLLAEQLERETESPVLERVARMIRTECQLGLWTGGRIETLVPEERDR